MKAMEYGEIRMATGYITKMLGHGTKKDMWK